MLFSSSIFLFAFLPVVILIYYAFLRKSFILKNIFLLAVSLFFYAWGEPKFVLVMILSIIVNYALGLWAGSYKRWPLILATLVFNLGVLFIFKYLTFALENIGLILSLPWTIPQIVLPIGISFFTFQAMSYVLDVYRNATPPQKNLLYLGLYISFFPQLIAGPIVRYETVALQITGRKETREDFAYGVCRFILGLGKKVIIANNLAIVADKAFNTPALELTLSMAWLGVAAYALQIFFDFSGYSDMAIGLGRMFGFKFLENFNYPYISASISEFWRRWHISLGSWFRDYLYIPLGGSRVRKVRLVLNLLIVWGLTGIWHGANWTFLIWGLLFFVFIALEKLTGFEKKAPRLKPLKIIYTLLIVLIGWVFFRSASIGEAQTYLKTMFHLNQTSLISDTFYLYCFDNLCFFIAGILFSIPLMGKLSQLLLEKAAKLWAALQYLRPAAYIIIFVIAVSFLVKDSYNPFIYFNF